MGRLQCKFRCALDISGDWETHGAAQKVLQLLVLEYSLVDRFRKTNGNEIIFTWGRQNSQYRLDRVYVLIIIY